MNILISKSKKNGGVGSDCDETSGTIRSTLRFDSSDVSPIKTEVIEKDYVKSSPARFCPTYYLKSNKKSRAVASRGVRGKLPSPRPWTCWARHIKSVDGFVFFRLSYFNYSDLQLFSIFILEVDFYETYLIASAKNSVSEPPNLKLFWGRIPPDPPTRFVPSALAIMPPPPNPRYKKPTYGPEKSKHSRHKKIKKARRAKEYSSDSTHNAKFSWLFSLF